MRDQGDIFHLTDAEIAYRWDELSFRDQDDLVCKYVFRTDPELGGVPHWTTDLHKTVELMEHLQRLGWNWTSDYRQDSGLYAFRLHRGNEIYRGDSLDLGSAVALAAILTMRNK
jgi:hypothetical protein